MCRGVLWVLQGCLQRGGRVQGHGHGWVMCPLLAEAPPNRDPCCRPTALLCFKESSPHPWWGTGCDMGAPPEHSWAMFWRCLWKGLQGSGGGTGSAGSIGNELWGE